MNISSDINILGSMPDYNLIYILLNENNLKDHEKQQYYTKIKTIKSYKRFEKAIKTSVLKYYNANIEDLLITLLNKEQISFNSLFLLFWNTSLNNELLDYLNQNVYFPAFYSGRMSLKKDEIAACLKDLKLKEPALSNWSDSTLQTTASKYLTLLKKFNLMEWRGNKNISHPYINDKLFMIFVYWLISVESKTNVLESKWLNYCFSEKESFIQRIMQKKFTKCININYTGDKLTIENSLPYKDLYDKIN